MEIKTEIIMKRTYSLLAAALMLVTACHEPEYVESNADRQGLTSLTAVFTFGPYVDQDMAKLTITDDTQERYVIPIPYYFPETSDDETTVYMTSVRVKAELQPNFSISPSLTVLDLTQDNWFTYTNPAGESRQICITGERVKSSACDIESFTLSNPDVSGVVNKEKKYILLPTKDDVTAATASVLLSAHASISPDPSQPRDYSQAVKFTVTAHDGTTCEYTVETGDPEKIDYGFTQESLKQLFNLDPVSMLGLPGYNEQVYTSVAAIGGNLIVSCGNGTDPMIINGLNGTKTGSLKTGLELGAITNDEAGNLVLVNYALGGEEAENVQIYTMASTKDTPKLVCEFLNPSDCPVGHRLKVMGDINNDAVITLTSEGIDGVTNTSKFISIQIAGGTVVSTDLVDLTSTGLAWGSAPVNITTVVPVSLDPMTDGWMLNYYEGGDAQTGDYIDMLHYISGSLADTQLWTYGDALAWGYNANCLDSKSFNGVRYAAMFLTSHFPQWGIGPMIYVYDISDPTAPALMFSKEDIKWYQTGANGVAAGDVVMAPSTDGYKMYVYCYDHSAQSITGYSVDCIKR